MHDRDRIAKHKPIGPFAPPSPSEVDAEASEPMAVARDRQQTHGESFVATTAPMDQYSEEVARRYKQVPARKMRPKSRDETRAAESPPGFREPDENGWAAPEDEE